MSAIEINKLIASVLFAGLIFMAINVGVDEFLHEETAAVTVYPVPKAARQPAAMEESAAAEEPLRRAIGHLDALRRSPAAVRRARAILAHL